MFRNRELISLIVGRLLLAAGALATLRISTGILGPSEVGRMHVLLSLTTFWGLLVVSPVGNFVTRQVVEWHAERRLWSILQQYTGVLFGSAALATVSLLTLRATFGVGIEISQFWLLSLAFGVLFFETLNRTAYAFLNILQFRGRYVILANLSLWGSLVVAWLASAYGTRDAEHWVGGIIVGHTLALCGSAWVLRNVIARPDSDGTGPSPQTDFNFRNVLGFSWPIVLSSCFYWFQTSGYRLVLLSFADVSTVGLFVVGLAVTRSPIVMFDTLFTEYYRPLFYTEIAHSDPEKKARAWNRYASAYFPTLVLIGVFFVFGGRFLVQLLVGEEFRTLAWLTGFGATIQVLASVNSTYATLS